MLDREPADLIADRCSSGNQSIAHSVDRLKVQLLS